MDVIGVDVIGVDLLGVDLLGVDILGVDVLGPAFPQFRTAQCCAIADGKPTFTARADIAQIQTHFVD